ncbi:glycosyltransferase family 4 protein [Facklamia sp. P9177]|uniref:glycosyltransferase family 4 protein n=1 Tax=Facklamia sp. P9177 TaxID=3421945 RepID=UPI003D184AEC
MNKICFLMGSLNNKGGLERVVSVLANELSTNGYKVTIILANSIKNTYEISYDLNNDIEVIHTNKLYRRPYDFLLERILLKSFLKFKINLNGNIISMLLFPILERKRYRNFFNHRKFDVIIGVTPFYSRILTFLNLNLKRIGWFHNTYERYFELEDSPLYKTEKAFINYLNDLDDLVVLSDRDKKIYSSKLNVLPKRIYNPLTIKSKRPNSISIDNRVNILFVGRIYYQTKGLELLFDIIKKVVKEIPNVCFNIVGDGPDKNRLLKDINTNKLSDVIVFHGSSNDVSKFYLTNDIFVLPSLIEGFGLVVTEAMSFGLPVISFKTHGPSEIITEGYSGYLIDKYDTDEFSKKIINLIRNPELRKNIGKRAYERSQNFSKKIIISEWIDLIEN